MKKLNLLLLFICTLNVWQMKGQTGADCSNAISIIQPFTQTYSSGVSERWYQFKASSTTLQFDVTQHTNQVNIRKIELYAGSCSTLTLLGRDSLTSSTDTVLSVQASNLTNDVVYYARVVFIDKTQKYDYNLVLSPLDIATDPEMCVTNVNTQITCCIDDDVPDYLYVLPCEPNGPLYTVYACLGDPIAITYNYYGSNIQLNVYFNGNSTTGTLVYTANNNAFSFTPTTPGTYYFMQDPNTTIPNVYTGITVIVGGSNTTPLSSISPPNGPYCVGECITFTSLNTNVFNTSFSTNDAYIPCTSGGTPPQVIPNTFIFSNPGINTVNYTINGGSTCEQTFPIPVTISTPVITISSTIPTPCSFDRVFTANLSCIPLGTSPTYNWTIYNGTSNSGAVVYTSSFASNVLNYTFPASGTYYLEVQSSTGFTGGQIITILPLTIPAINITSTALNLCDVPKVIKGQAFITLNPNVTMGTGDVATWTATDANTFATLSIPYYIGANGIINYNMFAFTGYPNPITFCVDIITFNGCENKQCFTLFPCCPKQTGTIVYSNTTFTTNTTLINSNTYRFSGIITINPGVQLYLKKVDVSFDPNTKIIVLGSNGQLKSDNSYLHGCSAMWDGIYLYASSRIDLTETTIEDAKRAVVDTLGASDIAIDYSWFNKNYEGIILKSQNTNSSFNLDHTNFTDDHIPTAYTTVPVSINAIAPSIISAYTRAHLLPPYNAITIKPYSGITLIQTKTPTNTNQYVIIGDNNIFDKLHYGIVATRSKLWVRKNSFFNMDARGDVGILIAGASTGLQNLVNPSDVKIGGTVAEANDFNTSYNGVISNYASALTVRNNNFIFSNTAITVNANNRNKIATIDRNKINASKIGILCYNNISLNAQITENTLVNATAVGLYNANIGITINEVVTTAYTKYNVYNNSINGYFNGIYATHTYSAQITDNEAHLTPTTFSGQDQYGIRIEGTNLSYVINNTIDKPSADYNAVWQNGIYAGTNTTPVIMCNGITNMGTSLKFDGPNTTITGLGIINNIMSFGEYGIWLNNSAEIGSQSTFGLFGNPNGTSNNKWFGFSSSKPQTFTSNGSNVAGGGSVMYTKNNTPPGNAYYLNPANATSNGLLGALPLFGNYTYPVSNLTCNNPIVTPLRMQNANKIATNTMGFTGNTANLYAISKRQLLDNIKLNNLNISTDAVLKAFVDSAYTTHLGQFYQVDSIIAQAIASGSASVLNTARTLNNSIANTGNIVYNKQTLNTTYMNMLSAEPDSLTLADLRDLAVKCPNLDGGAVFQARSILMYYDKQMYTSFCESDFATATNHRLGNIDNTVVPEEPKELTLYPNPTNRDITIAYTKGDDNEAAELVVFNQLGELVLTKTLTENKTTFSLEQLNSGIYFYTIKQQGEVLKTSKLVITK
jgi:hypothetical protein